MFTRRKLDLQITDSNIYSILLHQEGDSIL